MDDTRKSTRAVLSMDIDIREYRRSHITEQRKIQSAIVSKMIQERDHNRG
ncbi:MAG: hypothetical protein Q9M43_00360 [Sulfurimonas sp.]|nr:hypothetical protein [Sulfurimonas sp.]